MRFALVGVLSGLAAVLVGCTDSREAEIRHLQTEVDALKATAPTQAVAERAPKFMLIVSWPTKGGNDLRQPYNDAATCELARQAVFAENARREQAAKDRIDEENATANGYRVIAGSAPPAASAVCLPV